MSGNLCTISRLTCLIGLGMVVLSGCTKPLEVDSLETEIRESVIRQGGLSLKTVICPKNVPLEPGRAFDCVGELDSGDLFAIAAKQTDNAGKVEWDVPNTKGLLNLIKLETLFQETLKASEGKTLAIECGQGYRAVKPGESFECQIKQSATKPAGKTKQAQVVQPTSKSADVKPTQSPKPAESILVTIDPESNVNWRQVVSVVSAQPVASKSSASNVSLNTPVVNQLTTPVTSAAKANLSEEAQKDLEERFD